MDIVALSYTVGVKRRFLPFYKKYSVVGHTNESLAGSTRLVLNMRGGSVIVIPEIHKKYVQIYPDYLSASSYLKKVKEEKKLG